MNHSKYLKYVYIVILAVFVQASPLFPNESSMRIMTFNVRVNVKSDSADAWPNRKDIAASMIRFHKADIIGLQEALKEQVDDLALLLPEYKWFGIGRDDGKNAGEFMAVFYRSDRFDVLTDSTFWLSETPGIPGKGWDAACNRVVTFGKFKDIKNGKIFFLFNTHFDHMGQVARRESAKFLLQSIAKIGAGLPVIVTGDFNSTPESEPYKILTQGVNGMKLTDSKNISQYPHHGPTGTWTGFESAYYPDGQPIDYIFIRNNVKVLMHGTLSDSFDGRFPTDHMPVLAELKID